MIALLVIFLIGITAGALVERALARRSERGQDLAGRPRRKRHVLRWVVLAVVLATIGLAVGGYLWANSVFDKIEKVDTADNLSHGSAGTNYLLVGADNGQDGTGRAGVEGVRSDTILVLNIDGSKARMMSLNRDLWVTNPATGQEGRLNGTYNQGPANLVRAVTDNFGIPIDRYIEIDFTSFAGMVDAFGGIDVEFANPAIDRASGLVVPTAGVVHLDGEQALAYVRSRHYTEIIDGQEVPEGGLPDVNRTQRQQTFLRAVMDKASSSRNPLTLMRAADDMSGGLRVDDEMRMLDAARFAWSLGRLDPETVILPVVPRTTSGGAEVLELGDGAEEILATFR
ncbi:MAG: LCP family protein [Actinobacteria bacterium]|nr:LCP family protein [Actinomycetota bacterium]